MCPLSDHIKGQRRPVDKSISPSEEAQREHGLRESRSISGPRMKVGEEKGRLGQEKLWHLLLGEKWAREVKLNC